MSGVRIRRAAPGDAEFLVALLAHEDVEPFLGPGAGADRDAVVAAIERSLAEPTDFGRFVIEVAEEGEWRRAGALGFHVTSRHSRIAKCEGLAVDPAFRGRGVADEAARLLQRELLLRLGYHRLELECYGFNERAMRHAERVGYVREGVKRNAYWRHGGWVDGVLFGLVQEDVSGLELLDEHVARFNAGVESGDWGPMLELFLEDAELRFEGVPLGPFAGRAAIADAYRELPPDDTIELLGLEERDGVVVAAYSWSRDAGARSGELRLTPRDGRIARLVVTFDV